MVQLIEDLKESKMAYMNWDKKRLELEKLLLYEKLTLINTILKEKEENRDGQNVN